MTIALDTTVGLSTAQINGLLANNVSCVFRYVAPQSWKRITPAEYGRIVSTKMQIALNWESAANDFSNPNINWTNYTNQAIAQAKACGYPDGKVIYFSADEDIKLSQWPTMKRAIATIQAHIAPYRLGIYGPWDALEWSKGVGVEYFWQCMSTSYSNYRNRNKWPGTHVWQRRNATIAGVEGDANDIIIPNFGQANQIHNSTEIKIEVQEMFLATNKTGGDIYLCDGMHSRYLATPAVVEQIRALAVEGWIVLANGGTIRAGWSEDVFGKLGTTVTMTDQDIEKIAELVAAKVTAGASVEEVKAVVTSALNGTKLTTT